MNGAFDLKGRRALVTGASSGIGAGVASALAAQGASIALLGRDAYRLRAVADGLAGTGHTIHPLDLMAIDELPGRVRDIAATGGPLDGIVHSAGVMALRPLRIVGAADWDAAWRTNVAAAAALVKGFRVAGVNRGGGSVVFLTSVTGLVGHGAQSVYSATKGALISLSRALAIELAGEKIRVNCIAPAVVAAGVSERLKSGMSTEQWQALEAKHPLGLGKPEDVGNAAVYLMADSGRWITGTTLVLDGGYTAL